MPTLITPDSPLSLEQVSVDTWVRFARSQPLQVGQFSTIANTIELAPGRLDGIIHGMLTDDMAPFLCHKTVHSRKGGTWADDGTYEASGNEAMCAGAAAVLMKRGRPTVAMRIAFVTGQASPTQWEHIAGEVIE